MIRSLYDWTMRLAAHSHSKWMLGIISFIESSFFPIPPDVLLIPMILANRRHAWRLALLCTFASVLGGVLGYAIGYFLFDQIGEPLLTFYGYSTEFESFKLSYNESGAWIVLTAGMTFIPFKIITILSGMTGMDPITFIIFSIIGRGSRFLLEATLLWFYGERIKTFIESRLQLVTAIFCILLLMGIIMSKHLL